MSQRVFAKSSSCGRLLPTLLSLACAVPVFAQQAAAPAQPLSPAAAVVVTPAPPTIKFDIISFKPCKNDRGSASVLLPPDGDTIGYNCQPISRILYFAFLGPQPFVLTGEPGWVDDDRYDFQAKVAPEDIAVWQKMGLQQKRLMVRGVLADELHLTLHEDTTPRSVYNLVADKGGMKLKVYKDGESTDLPDGRKLVGRDATWLPDGTAIYQGTKMSDLAETLATRVGRQVLDRTGAKELYDFTLYMPLWHYDTGRADADDSPIPRIFAGLKPYGLKLEPGKAATGGLVVDHIERPPEN